MDKSDVIGDNFAVNLDCGFEHPADGFACFDTLHFITPGAGRPGYTSDRAYVDFVSRECEGCRLPSKPGGSTPAARPATSPPPEADGAVQSMPIDSTVEDVRAGTGATQRTMAWATPSSTRSVRTGVATRRHESFEPAPSRPARQSRDAGLAATGNHRLCTRQQLPARQSSALRRIELWGSTPSSVGRSFDVRPAHTDVFRKGVASSMKSACLTWHQT